MLPVLRSIADLRKQVSAWRQEGVRKDGARIGLVPTMGALHEGHLTLVRRAKERAGRVIASVFVNPTQFGPNEDFAAYPRNEDADRKMLESAGADAMYAPGVADIYPPGFVTKVSVVGLAERLEGKFRPGHFDGVATVVTKLLSQAQPDIAVFGEKDYQQLQVISQLARDLDLPVEILGIPTVREKDGLAMSSRNAYLTSDERKVAPTLYRALSQAVSRLEAGGKATTIREEGRAELLRVGFSSVDYFDLCDARTLEPIPRADRPARLLVAAQLGRARLIDNIEVKSA